MGLIRPTSFNDTNKRRRSEQYQDMIGRLYPDLTQSGNKNSTYFAASDKKSAVLTRTITFQVTDACNLACKYCYQINKGVRRMSFETAKKFIDLIISGEKNMNIYVDPSFSPAIVVEFIGGEPFLEIELIEKICDYFCMELIKRRHPWAEKMTFSICSNGVLYFDPRVQHFLRKYKDMLSFSVTIDGNKELHDSCRVFPDGSPSYDLAVAAAQDWMNRGYFMGSKITIAPGNLDYLYDAIIHMIELGYDEINANCVYEKGWEVEHATKFYYELKRIADFFVEHDLVSSVYLSLFIENSFSPKDPSDNQNWCGGDGQMISCDPDGWIYPCIRYMESSLGTDQEPLRIGHVDYGIGYDEKCKDCLKCLKEVNRRAQSTDECFYCPIAEGCSWCSAYNYQVNGTINKRVTYICIMHKARALANVYFWNTWYKKKNLGEVFVNHVPDEWALEIIPQEELDMLKSLERR